ncbi:hypothetical protein T552_03044 [Pneumocystis carinii B80]|uniref:CAP-Gly domain-containing protein n=1 Tax=Pneumocystis carinii (strain B80) TaxID=1408658 RepID=A0A0W4ZCJ9_PNEC8|nr:hypothetical protein T552_03044 [Pneumocystis carinii B80]KTW26152.1 hypothetical protein T552_03044 [Pneumocystis carinii B80]
MGILINIVWPEHSIERYIELSWTVTHLKERLELITGIPVAAQHLTLSPNVTVADSTITLDKLNIQPNTSLYVSDSRDQVEIDKLNSEDVEHFKISDEAYAARPDTFSKWKETHISTPSKIDQAWQKIYEKGIEIDQRCSVEGENKTRNGRVRFIGQVKGLPEGIWIGVEYDSPVGKNDGTFQGIRYFTANENYGSFLPPNRIQIIPCSPTNTDLNEEI